MTNVRRYTVWSDTEGRQVLTRLYANGSLATLTAALAAQSVGALLYNTESADLSPTQADAGGAYDTNVERAVLLFTDAAGLIVKVLLPMPAASIFLSDNVTVDPTQITSIISAVIGTVLSASGSPATAYKGGFRDTAGTQPAGIAPAPVATNTLAIDHSGAAVGTRPALNVIDGANVALTVADNAGANRVDLTIAATTATLRVDSGGNLQVSYDGGVTWSTVTGWTVPNPSNPGSVSTATLACNIASHLAQNIIQQALQAAVTAFNSSLSDAVAAASILALIPGVGPEYALAIDAAAATAYFIYHNGTIGDYQAAASSAVLATALECAIYNVIHTDGQVTASNAAAVATAIHAVGWTPSDVQSAIDTYVSHLGTNGLLQAQALGGIVAGDCTPCTSPPPTNGNCAIFNGTDDYATMGAFWNPGTGPFTVMLWMYCQASVSAQTPFSNIGNTLGQGEMWILQGGASARFPDMVRGVGDGSHGREWNDNNDLALNAWHHFAVSWPSLYSSTPSFYIDGSGQGLNDGGNHLPGLGAAPALVVGALNDSPIRLFWTGKMRSLRCYNQALTGMDIAAIAAGGVSGAVAAGFPIHWWEMNDGSGSSIQDYGSAGQALTWHGTGAHWSTV